MQQISRHKALFALTAVPTSTSTSSGCGTQLKNAEFGTYTFWVFANLDILGTYTFWLTWLWSEFGAGADAGAGAEFGTYTLCWC